MEEIHVSSVPAATHLEATLALVQMAMYWILYHRVFPSAAILTSAPQVRVVREHVPTSQEATLAIVILDTSPFQTCLASLLALRISTSARASLARVDKGCA